MPCSRVGVQVKSDDGPSDLHRRCEDGESTITNGHCCDYRGGHRYASLLTCRRWQQNENHIDQIHMLETASSIALAFAEHGCEQIYLGDNTLGALEASRNAIKKRYPSVQVHIQAFDRSNEDSVDQFILKTAECLKRIDYAVNVVSQAQESDLPREHSVEGFDRNYHIYQRGVRLLSKAIFRLARN